MTSEQPRATPIDTVREALERVKVELDALKVDAAGVGPMVPPACDYWKGVHEAEIAHGRYLLEALEKYGGDLGHYPDMHYHDWAHALAQSYARRVGELAG